MRPVNAMRNVKKAAAAISCSILASFFLVTSHSAQAGGGNGGGVSGPTLYTDVIKLDLVYGVSGAELRRAVRTCLLTGDRSRGLESVMQEFYHSMFGEENSTPANAGPAQGELHLSVSPKSRGSDLDNYEILFSAHYSYRGVDILLEQQQDGSVMIWSEALQKSKRLDTPIVTSGTAFPQVVSAYYLDPTHRQVDLGSPLYKQTQLSKLSVALDSASSGDPTGLFKPDSDEYVECLRTEIQHPYNEKKPAAIEALPALPSPDAPAVDCDWAQSWLAALGEQQLPSLPAKSAVSEAVARKDAANALIAKFRQGLYSEALINQCVGQSRRRQNLLNTFYSAFFDSALSELKQINIPELSKLLDAVDEYYRHGGLKPIWRLTGHFGEPSPTDDRAGVSASSGSIFVDLARIKPHELNIVLVHELLHVLDPRIALSENSYIVNGGLDQLSWIESRMQDRQLQRQKEEQDDYFALHRWITAGLNRGLYAECRAWRTTFDIYHAGKAMGAFQAVDWLDEVDAEFAQQKVTQDHLYFLFNLLNSRAKDPTSASGSDPFSFHVFKSMLTDKRELSGDPDRILPCVCDEILNPNPEPHCTNVR